MAAGARTYSDAINALNSLQTNFATLEALRRNTTRAPNRFAIAEMTEFVQQIGYDLSDLDRLRIVHVTGTKGKGSTCAFVGSILNECGMSGLGVYTSPHLKSVRERIAVGGLPISEEKFARYFFEVWDMLANAGVEVWPVYFRYLTLLSFHVFMQENVNSAVYEVGIGGEYDSTNVILHPTVVGISSIGLDHTRILGNTLQEIAWNKAGIMKRGTKAFSVEQKIEAWDALQARADEKSVELVKVPVYDIVHKTKLGIDAEFQKVNASLALALAREHLRVLGVYPSGLSEDEFPAEFVRGLENTRWAGRCQTVVDGEVEWLIDGAHTDDSIAVATEWYRSKAREGTKKVLVFNQQSRDAKALVDKLHSILGTDAKFDEAVFCTNVTYRNGAYNPELASMNTSEQAVHDLVVQKQLAEEWIKLETASKAQVMPTIEDTVEHIRSLGQVQVLVTGSLHLVGGLLVILDL
ncbi:Mur ligase [Lipomyces arxii]|uniref:Mur ligase n=1 Tax=Lipomyces arxii TaxID=56418 RepID=UPI0034CD1B33